MILSTLRERALDIVFPPFCVCCGQEDTWLCAKCLSSRPTSDKWPCLVCEEKTDEHAICDACRDKQTLQGIIISGHFDQIMQKAVHALKYKYAEVLAPPLAQILAKSLEADQVFQSFTSAETLLVPVPLHPKRKNERGFNQSELLAREIARRIPGLKVSNALERRKATSPQMELNRASRLQNVKDAFVLSGEATSTDGKTVILIDDVSTTGATLFNCAEALKAAGPKAIWAAVLGHG